MAAATQKKLFPNPFYLALVIVSTIFVMTALGYWIVPMLEQARADHPEARTSPASLALMNWLDRRGAVLLGIEFAVMTALAFAAMALDDHFDRRKAKSKNAGP